MLGRKQSLRGELLPYEAAQEETNNESVGVDWMNKVKSKLCHSINEWVMLQSIIYIAAMDETSLAIERSALSLFRLSQHAQDVRTLSLFTSRDVCLRFDHRPSLYGRNGGED